MRASTREREILRRLAQAELVGAALDAGEVVPDALLAPVDGEPAHPITATAGYRALAAHAKTVQGRARTKMFARYLERIRFLGRRVVTTVEVEVDSIKVKIKETT